VQDEGGKTCRAPCNQVDARVCLGVHAPNHAPMYARTHTHTHARTFVHIKWWELLLAMAALETAYFLPNIVLGIFFRGARICICVYMFLCVLSDKELVKGMYLQ